MKKLVNFKGLALIVASSAILSFSPVAVASEATGFKHYIVDIVQVPLRRGPSIKHRISRMMDSGSPITVLEINDEQWARIEYIDNRNRKHTGWMASILLSTQPAARVQLENELASSKIIKQQKIQLTEEIGTLTERLNITQTELDSVNKEAFEVKQQHIRLKEVSGDAVNISRTNLNLKQQVSELQVQNNSYREQLIQAEDVVERQWFLTGGGVLLLGIILGLLLRKPKRKQKWDSF